MATLSPLFLRDDELEQALQLFWLAERDLMEAGTRILERRDLAVLDYLILFFLMRRPDSTLAELCILTGASKQSLSRHVAKLRAGGYVCPGSARGDRRAKPLRLTEQGREVLAPAIATQKRYLSRVFRDLGAPAVEGFLRVLAGLAEQRTRRLLSGGRA